MKKKVTIHIGMPKTGSTWLQNCILPLIKTVDVCYKESFRYSMLKWSKPRLLLSYENYAGYPHKSALRGLDGWMATRARSLSNLSALFPSADIILVVRKQSELLRSIYNQYIKVGGCISFDDYCFGDSSSSVDKDALLYMNLLKQVRAHFNGSILLLSFELFKSDKSRFGKFFLDFAGAQDEIDFERHGSRRINVSLTQGQIKHMLKLNKWVQTEYSPDGIKLRSRNRYKRYRRAVLALSSLVGKNKSHGIFNDETIKRLDDYYISDWGQLTSLMDGDCAVLGPQGGKA